MREIENELNQTTKRLDELTEMRDGINNNLQALQQGFVDGKTTLDELQTEQGKLTILNESIKALEAKQDELHTAFQKASLSESNQKLLESATEAAREAETIFNESLEIRNELDAAIGQLAGKLFDTLSSFNEKRKQYLAARFKIPAGEKTPELSEDLFRLLERNQMSFPPIEFGAALGAAYEQIRRQKEKQELVKTSAA
jgi:uncharacterized coiled-coil DUF342 family protein